MQHKSMELQLQEINLTDGVKDVRIDVVESLLLQEYDQERSNAFNSRLRHLTSVYM